MSGTCESDACWHCRRYEFLKSPELVHVTQPTLAAAMRKLEARLENRLPDRKKEYVKTYVIADLLFALTNAWRNPSSKTG